MEDTMRDLLSKLDAIVSETALNPKDPKGDYDAKKRDLDNLEKDGKTNQSAIQQRRLDLDKEAESKGVKEDSIFEVGDDFGISFSEDLEIATEIVGFVEDGIIIELDDTALGMLEEQGVLFLEGELVNEEKQKGVDGKACWKGYKRMGTKMKGGKRVDNCVKMGEDLEESGLQYYTGKKKYGKDGMAALSAAGREGASEEELGRIKDKFKKEDHNPEDPEADYNVGEYDREGDMAKDQLRTINSAAKELYAIIDANENLPEWVQKKIVLAMDYIDTARDYLKSNKYAESTYNEDKDKASSKMYDWLMYHGSGYADMRDANDEMLGNDLLGLAYHLDKGNKSFKDVEDWIFANIKQGHYLRAEYLKNFARSNIDKPMSEAEYQGKEVPLGKKLPGDVKKSKVYVRNPNGKVVKVNFGDKKMRIKKSNPARRKSFRARHNCANPGPRHKARYWSCRSW
jgi:hypothetical protein